MSGPFEVELGDRFAIVPGEVIADSRLSLLGLRTFLVLAFHANRDRVAWPEQATLARLLNSSRWKIRQAIDELRTLGWIEIQQHRDAEGKRSSNTYLLYPFRPLKRDSTMAGTKHESRHGAGGPAEDLQPWNGGAQEGRPPVTDKRTDQVNRENLARSQ